MGRLESAYEDEQPDTVSSHPDSSGATATPRLRGTAATLAAAGRSSGVTTAMTLGDRIGTSIWESSACRISSPNAADAVGSNAVSIRNVLDDRCVKTMVFTSPKRRASGTAAKYDATDIGSHRANDLLGIGDHWQEADLIQVSQAVPRQRVNVML